MREERHAATIEQTACREVPGGNAREETMTRAEGGQTLPLRGREWLREAAELTVFRPVVGGGTDPAFRRDALARRVRPAPSSLIAVVRGAGAIHHRRPLQNRNEPS